MWMCVTIIVSLALVNMGLCSIGDGLRQIADAIYKLRK